MTTLYKPLCRACLTALALAAPLPSLAAYQFYMDSFVVARGFSDGTTDPGLILTPSHVKFYDEFDAGGPPPDLTGVFNADQNGNGSGDFTYVVNVASNGTVGPEVDYQGFQDLLSLNSADAVLSTSASGSLRMRQFQIRNAETGTGLGRGVTFAVVGVFQWIVPGLGQNYGIQVQDRNSSIPGDDIISLQVRGLGGGEAELRLARSVYETGNGFSLGVHLIEAETLAPPAGTAFIALALTHPVAFTDPLYASWYYADENFDLLDGYDFATAALLFHGETSGYRAAFFAAEPVPEPGTWVLRLAGLGLVAWAAGRRQA